MAASKLTLSQVMERLWLRIGLPDASGCRRWLGPLDRHGYAERVRLGGQRIRAYALAWRATYHGPTKPGAETFRHSCDHPWCCEPSHVYPGTNFENVLDMLRRGRNPAGECHYKAKLSDATIAEIRARLRTGMRGLGRRLAAEYGMTETAISAIKNHRNRTGGSPWRAN